MERCRGGRGGADPGVLCGQVVDGPSEHLGADVFGRRVGAWERPGQTTERMVPPSTRMVAPLM